MKVIDKRTKKTNEDYKYGDISIEDTYEDGYTGIDRYENGDVYINGNELNLSCDVEVTYVSKSSKINYCPMCGRKLTEKQKW